MGTLVNLLRVKRLIKQSKKYFKTKRPIIFALDIAAAFDRVPRGLLLKSIQSRIKN